MKTHFDLFSGIGGFALAAQRCGLVTVGFSEIEPYACNILKRHWPDVPNYGDIRNVRNVRADLITGGFPCQPFSLAGKRRGAADDRALWPEMRRVIAEARPAWVLGENVPGIIGMELDSVLSDLEGIGYSTGTLVIPACAVDARHRRDRVWIVANAGHEHGRTGRHIESGATYERGPQTNQLERSSQDVAYAEGCYAVHNEPECQWRPAAEFENRSVRREGCRWEPEPELGRVAHGIPNRTHRLKGLGNAIVPQIAEMLIRTMVRVDEQPIAAAG